jgi:murein DD-endopeptidase MepM/ murein hydrolase activator NlpD
MKNINYILTILILALFVEVAGELKKENEIYKESLEAIRGGIGSGAESVDYTRKETDRMIKEHGLQLYTLSSPALIFPVCDPARSYVRSERGYRSFRGRVEWHDGIDIVPKYDGRVRAAHGGRLSSGVSKIYGNYIVIDNGFIQTRYSHLSKFYKRSGDVLQGEVIGIVGQTGKTSGVHLDFELYEKWQSRNPVAYSTYQVKYEP